MKIITWNVNGIRAVAQKWFKEFIELESPDILCIQETKAFEEQFLKDVWDIDWYNYIWHSWTKAWYAWTAIFYKKKLEILNWRNHFEEVEHFHTDWRITEIKINDFVLINGYFPNWWTRADWTEMLWYKLEFYNKLIDYANKLVKSGENVVITWDFNICHTVIDIARPKENEDSIWFLPVERAKITELLNNWYIDTFRYFYPDKKDVYSWWSYRAWARPRNIWWRLDYFVVNKDFIDKIEAIEYMTSIMWSDHCPVKLIIK
jgi:exodeoxyribonuclease-3